MHVSARSHSLAAPAGDAPRTGDGPKRVEPPPPMLADFLAFTLAGGRPGRAQRQGRCADGIRYAWLDEGVLELAPAAGTGGGQLPSVLVSAGVHGDETAPIELLSRMIADIACGAAPLACRLGVVLGNVAAMRAGARYIDDDLNRLFCGRHLRISQSGETRRAAVLEAAAQRFFADAATGPHARWHVDMHTAIRASVFERFALLPYTGAAPSRAMFEWLARARIEAVLLHTAQGATYTHFTAESFGADACTLELGKVRPFGENDLSRFAGADEAVRALIAGAGERANTARLSAMPRVFTVVGQITKQSDTFELLMADDIANFTPFPKGTVLARDGEYSYAVTHDEERIVFPNRTVKPGLRAGLTVVETTHETLAALAP